jgi:hypothetical protein
MTKDDVTFLVDRVLLQIAIGKYQIIFNFDQNISISVESDLEYRHRSEIAHWSIGNEDIPEKMPWLKLVGHHISTIQWLEDKSLKLSFENSNELIFFKGTKGYESFQITKDGRVWVF